TLGVGIAAQPIALVAGRVVAVELGTPSPGTVRGALCPRSDTIRAPGLLVGRLRDADTDAPAAGARVSLVYSEIQISSVAGVHRIQRLRQATVTANGTYAI